MISKDTGKWNSQPFTNSYVTLENTRQFLRDSFETNKLQHPLSHSSNDRQVFIEIFSHLATWTFLFWNISFCSGYLCYIPPKWVTSTLTPVLASLRLAGYCCSIAAEADQEVWFSSCEAGDSISSLSSPIIAFQHYPLQQQQRFQRHWRNPQFHRAYADWVPELHHRMPLSLLSARSILPSVSHRVCRCRWRRLTAASFSAV